MMRLLRQDRHSVSHLIGATMLILCLGCRSVPPAAPAPTPPTSAAAGATTIVAVAPPAAPSVTLPQFLGLDLLFGGVRQLGQRIRNRLGARFPGLESKPPVLAITDPANTGPDASPAVQAAAEAKAEEDQEAQKAKAIRYLASRGCGDCYPDTEAALLSALEDCSEVIRYETVKGLRGSVGGACQCCRENSCCTEPLLKKLYELAYEREDSGCYVESSARVRRNARLVICACGGVPSMEIPINPIEGPPSGESVIIEEEPLPAVEATASKSKDLDAELDRDESKASLVRNVKSNATDQKLDKQAAAETNLGEDIPGQNAVRVAGLVSDGESNESTPQPSKGFVLPADFELPPDSEGDSVRLE